MTGEEAHWAGVGPDDFREYEDDHVNPDDPGGDLRRDRDAEVEANNTKRHLNETPS